jgi:hypothetical protein
VLSTRRLLAVPVVALLLGCGGGDPRLSTPATTFRTYRNALASGDAATSWSCLSTGYRRLEYDQDPELWAAHLQGDGHDESRVTRRLEISQETLINDRVAFLQFDASTVDPGHAPFFYFLHEPEGWKITTHLDSLFRVELESAIDHGEFRLPGLRR